MSRIQILLIGAVAVLAVAELFHGPLGRAVELRNRVERRAQVARSAREVRTRVAIASGECSGLISRPRCEIERVIWRGRQGTGPRLLDGERQRNVMRLRRRPLHGVGHGCGSDT